MTPLPVCDAELRTRKSNGVAGFKYSRLKGVVYTACMILKFPLLPLWPVFVARETGDWTLCYPTRYLSTLAYVVSTLAKQVRYGAIARIIRYNILVNEKEALDRIETRVGACTRCAKCCRSMNCIFLTSEPGTGSAICGAYGKNYWYTTGRAGGSR